MKTIYNLIFYKLKYMDGGYYATKRIWVWLLFSPVILTIHMLGALVLFLLDLSYVREAKIVIPKRKLPFSTYVKFLNNLMIICIVAFASCAKEKQLAGNWYKFLTYYQGQRTGQFSVFVTTNRTKEARYIDMYQDSEGERAVYKGKFLNDTILLLNDVANNSGELYGIYHDKTITLTQFSDFTYIGTKK